MRDFRYVADNGNAYAIRADESNIRLIHDAAAVAVTGIGLLERPPANLKIRKVVMKDSTNLRTRVIPVLNLSTYTALNGNTDYVTDNTTAGADPNPGATFNVQTFIPEKRRVIPKLSDTGLNDGTQP